MSKKNYLVSSLIFAGLLASCAKDREFETVYKDAEITGKNAVNTSSEFLYVPTSLGVPRFTKASKPFVQGTERIVKFKFTEEGIVAYQMETNAEFQDNTLNNRPILTIPVDYKAYRCAEDSNDECTNSEEENTEITWDRKDKFIPKFEDVIVHEVDSVGLPSSENSCFINQGTRVVDYEITKTDINFQLEKTYKLADSPSCHWSMANGATTWEEYSDALDKNGSFNTRVQFSFAKLDTITTPGFKKVEYPVGEHGLFGFFTTSKDTKNSNNQDDKSYLMNHWNSGVVTYTLSDEFDKPENAYLKDATVLAFSRMNKVLEDQKVNLRLKLEMPSGKSPGNLRNTMIVLIEDLASGLLGYGPSVANPRTGEIVKAHTNMYKGSLESFAPYTYDNIVFLERQQGAPDLDNDDADSDMAPSAAQKSAQHNQAMRTLIAKAKEQSQRLSNQMGKKTAQQRHEQKSFNSTNDLDLTPSSDRISLKKLNKLANATLSTDKHRHLREKFTDRNSGGKVANQTLYKELEQINQRNEELHRNNVYTTDMLNFQALGKASVKDINKVEGIRDADGKLKLWQDLADSQRRELIKILARHAYIPTLVHEVGHNLGLRHNFAGSTDKDNFYTQVEQEELGFESQPAYSSIMDYAYSSLNELTTFGKYDAAALRFAYNKEVETVTGEIVSLEDENGRKDLRSIPGLKVYKFCTDENAGASLTCNRFDEGVNELEIVNHFIDKYNEDYAWLNVKNRSKKFNDGNSYWRYAVRRFNTMISMREIHEIWQGLHTYIGGFRGLENLTIDGCTPQQRAEIGSFCDYVGTINQANENAGRFLLDVVKTPDLTCDLAISATVSGQTLLDRVKTNFKLSNIVEDLEFEIGNGTGNYKPHTCLDENIKPALVEQFIGQIRKICTNAGAGQACQTDLAVNVEVVGESGKLHNDVDAAYRKDEKRFTGDLEIRGNWIDKAWAMEVLVDKGLMTTAGASNHFSYVDHPKFAAEIDNLMAHLSYGAPLQNPQMFTAKDGSKYHNTYGSDLNIKTKVPRNKWLYKMFIPFPDEENYKFGPVLVNMASNSSYVSSSDTQDVRKAIKRNAFHDSLQVWEQDRTLRSQDFGDLIIEEIQIGDDNFGATKKNTIALKLIKGLNGELEQKDEQIAELLTQIDTLEVTQREARLELARTKAAADEQAATLAQEQADALTDVQEQEAAQAIADEKRATAVASLQAVTAAEQELTKEVTAAQTMLKSAIEVKKSYNNAKNDVDQVFVIATTSPDQASANAAITKLAQEIGTARIQNAISIFSELVRPTNPLEKKLRESSLEQLNYFALDQEAKEQKKIDLTNSLFTMP